MPDAELNPTSRDRGYSAFDIELDGADVATIRRARLARVKSGRSCRLGAGLGLSNNWAYNVIKQVGNYAEVFERNVGSATPLGMARDQNALWKDGGLQFAPPIR